MTRLIRTALVAALGFLTIGGATADDAEDVVAAAQGVLKVYNSGDAKKASSFFTDDADYYSGNGRGLTDFDSDRLAASFEAGLSCDLEWQDLTARVHGNSAVSIGLLVGSVHLPDGTGLNTTLRNMGSWVKDGGKWKLTQFHSSDLKPDVTGAQAVISRHHQAFVHSDGEAARACLTASCVRTINRPD